MPNQRILKGTAATLTFTLYDSDGRAVDAASTVTVGVTKADGTVVITPGTATAHTAGQTGIYTKTLTGAQSIALDLYTATWTDVSTGSTFTTQHEIVGGYLFTISDARGFEILGSQANYPDIAIIAARAEVEDELEQLRDCAFVPRYARLTLDGTGTREIITGLAWLRTVRSVRSYTTTGATTYTPFTATELAACQVTEDGRIVRGDGNVFDPGIQNIVVEVEHGFTDWGTDLKNAALKRLRSVLIRPNSAVPERAKSYTDASGGTVDLVLASGGTTGYPEIDAIYSRYPRPATGPQPASRLLTFQPQYGGIFRGLPVVR